MDDKGDPRDEKDRLGLVATALRRSKHPLQKAAAEKLRYAPKRLSAIERGDAASREQLEDLTKRLGYHSLHLLKTLHLVEFLAAEQRKPLDPLGPTPDQEVEIYQATRELAAEFEAICRGNIRREKLEQARSTAEAQWERGTQARLERERQVSPFEADRVPAPQGRGVHMSIGKTDKTPSVVVRSGIGHRTASHPCLKPQSYLKFGVLFAEPDA